MDKTDNKEISFVRITDIKMSFDSMVIFMVKWVIASIPAALILMFLLFVMFSVFSSFFVGAGKFF